MRTVSRLEIFAKTRVLRTSRKFMYTVTPLLILTVTDADKAPSSCGMGKRDCQTLIGAWAVGANGECSHKDVGFRIGQNGFKHVMMQVGVRSLRPLLFFNVTRYIHVYMCREIKMQTEGCYPMVILTNFHNANDINPIFNLPKIYFFLFGYTAKL